MKMIGVLILILAISCTPKEEESSEVKFGAIDRYIEEGDSFLELQPGANVILCGSSNDYLEMMQEVIVGWLEIIGRKEQLNIQLSQTCPRPSFDNKSQWILEVKKNDGRDFEVSQQCGRGPLAYTRPLGRGYTEVVFCTHGPITSGIFGTAYHEAGHFVVAACDQYSIDSRSGNLVSGIGMHLDCSPIYRSPEATISVMNAGGANDLIEPSQDDRYGARVNACRSENLSNQLWADIPEVRSKMAKWSQDSSFVNILYRILAVSPSADFLEVCINPFLEP